MRVLTIIYSLFLTQLNKWCLYLYNTLRIYFKKKKLKFQLHQAYLQIMAFKKLSIYQCEIILCVVYVVYFSIKCDSNKLPNVYKCFFLCNNSINNAIQKWNMVKIFSLFAKYSNNFFFPFSFSPKLIKSSPQILYISIWGNI